MSEHTARVIWQRASADFTYQTYNRDHLWRFGDGVEVPASAAPEYMGSPGRVDPEQALVAALSSCHMLTFLALACKRRFVVDRYTDDAVGVLGKNADGVLAVTRVTLRPHITFAVGAAPSPGQLEELHELAHQHCFIANSVTTKVTVEHS
jgi:organic hydroperoxide reductase OsmC/OhrA